MKKGILALAIVGILICGNAYAYTGLTANASPAIVQVDIESPEQTITFPIVVRNVMVLNWDADDGVWINLRGNSSLISDSIYIGPSSVVSFEDYQTDTVRMIYDNHYGGGAASPCMVIGTY